VQSHVGGAVGRCFLVTFHPLVSSARGRRAVRAHRLRPFIDGSCRREPDFESPFPSITATCRAGNFAPRLRVNDRIVYLTVRGQYVDDAVSGWRLVAVLRVVQRFESHAEAAEWYKRQGLSLPSNCLVHGNPAMPFELTNGNPPKSVKEKVAVEDDPVKAIRLWDASYRQRIVRCPVFLSTAAEFIDLEHPPQVRESQMRAIFERIPGTLNPPTITGKQLERLLKLATANRAWFKAKSIR